MQVKIKIIDGILKVLKIIVLKLLHIKTQSEMLGLSKNNSVLDLRKLPDALKKYIIYDEDIVNKRMEECNNCEHYTGSRCRKCGCWMRVKSKFAHPIATCPIGKWDVYTS